MDELDSKIIQLMMRNARMPVKEIAKQVNLTSPAARGGPAVSTAWSRRASSAAIPCACTTPARITESRR